MSDEPVIGLPQQIRCVQRELAMRKGTYARLVARQAMSAEQAHYELAAMSAVLETLRGLEHGTDTAAATGEPTPA